jgi:hypothetical protein
MPQTVTLIVVNRCVRCEITLRSVLDVEPDPGEPGNVGLALERALDAARASGWTINPETTLCPTCSLGAAPCGAIVAIPCT